MNANRWQQGTARWYEFLYAERDAKDFVYNTCWTIFL